MSKREEDFEKAAMDYCEDHSHCIYFEAGCEYGYQYAIQHPQWISVKEEDPPQTLTWDNPIYFLGVTDKGGIHKMYRMGDPTVCKDLENDNLYLHVTHWMPIIPLPKK